MTYIAFTSEANAGRAQEALLPLYRRAARRFNDAEFEPGSPVFSDWAVYLRGRGKIDGERIRWRLPRQATVAGQTRWVVRVPAGFLIDGAPMLQREITVAPRRLADFIPGGVQPDVAAFKAEMGVPGALDPDTPLTYTIAEWSRGLLAAMGIAFSVVPDAQVTLT